MSSLGEDRHDDDERAKLAFFEFLAQQMEAAAVEEEEDGDHDDGDGANEPQTQSQLPQQPRGGSRGDDDDEEQIRLVSQTYRELCFDQPRITSPQRGCQLLADALVLLEEDEPAGRAINNHDKTRRRPVVRSISNRFVNGLLQALSASTSTEDAATATTTATTTVDDRGSSSFTSTAAGSGSGTGSNGISVLAMTTFLKIPFLVCCRAKSLEHARRWVGTYSASCTAEGSNRNNAADDDENDRRIRQLTQQREGGAAVPAAAPEVTAGDVAANGITNGHAPTPDDNSVVADVWAEESDPSDYSYGGDDNGGGEGSSSSGLADLQAWAAALAVVDGTEMEGDAIGDATTTATTWKDVAGAVSELLRECSYNKFPGLFVVPKWRKDAVKIATQLSLTLLLLDETHPRGDNDGADESSSPPSTSTSPHPPHVDLAKAYSYSYWQQQALVPIHLVRDAAQHNPTGVLDDYIELLRTMMQVHLHTARNSDNKNQTTSEGGGAATAKAATITAKRIPSATWLGLSLLSDLCSRSTAARERVSVNTKAPDPATLKSAHSAVLDMSDDLSFLIERACTTKNTSATAGNTGDGDTTEDEALIQALPWNFLSLFHLLSTSLSQTQSQTLLNSGLFRQWLLLWQILQQKNVQQDHPSNEGNIPPPVLRHVQQSILELCVASPKLLGKYAWRFPGLAAAVTRSPIATQSATSTSDDDAGGNTSPSSTVVSAVDALFWNLLGIELSSSNSGAVTVQWKTKKGPSTSSDLPPPTALACRETALKCFQVVLRSVISVASDWKRRREGDVPPSNRLADQQDTVACFVQVVERLSTTQLFSKLFVSELLLPGTTQEVDSKAADETVSGDFISESDLKELQDLLVHWPASKNVTIVKVKSDDNGEESAEKRAQRKRYAEDDHSIDELRRSVKQLKSILDLSSGGGDGDDNEVGRHSFSSKVD